MKRILFLLVAIITLVAVRYEAQTNSGSGSRNPSDSGPPWSTFGIKTDTSNLALQAAPGAGLRVYVYMAYCINTSASTQTIALIKTASATLTPINCGPAAIYAKPQYFDPPLAIAPNTALTMNSLASATSVYLFAEGTVAR